MFPAPSFKPYSPFTTHNPSLLEQVTWPSHTSAAVLWHMSTLSGELATRLGDEGVSFALNPIPLDNGKMSYTGLEEDKGWANTVGNDLRGHLSGSQRPQYKWERPQSCFLNKGSSMNGRRWCHDGIFPELRNSLGRDRANVDRTELNLSLWTSWGNVFLT